jgi:hypothetical protein
MRATTIRKIALERALLPCAALAIAVANHAGAQPSGPERPYTTWRSYGGGAHSSQYSALDQINESNVAKLTVVWEFPVGERSFVFNPIVAGAGLFAPRLTPAPALPELTRSYVVFALPRE